MTRMVRPGTLRLDLRGLLLQVGLQFRVLAADDDGLGGTAQAGQRIEHAGRGADAERAAGDEEERPEFVESGLRRAAWRGPRAAGRRPGRWGCR